MTLVVMLLGPVSPADQDIRTAAKEWSGGEEANWLGFVGEGNFSRQVNGCLLEAESPVSLSRTPPAELALPPGTGAVWRLSLKPNF